MNELHFISNLLLGIILGYFIGAEREARGKDAGISTHIMVICGSSLFTLLSATDPESKTRIAAQIVSGIGFLGAGLILKDTSSRVRNLTTAASIWFAGAIGMALGFGYYWIAIIASAVSIIVPRIPTHDEVITFYKAILKKVFSSKKDPHRVGHEESLD